MPLKVNSTSISAENKSEIIRTSPQSSSLQFDKQLKNESIKLLDRDLETLISEVKSEGEKFVKSPDEKNLASYKKVVKSFLNKLTQGFLSLKEHFGADLSGERKIFQVVQKTETDIDNLTKEALTENKALGLLGSLDDIRGLVLDVLG